MVLLIDNYDSFSFNLYQLISEVKSDVKIVRNDKIILDEIREMSPEAIVLSPGPGRPADAGICESVVKNLAGQIPILGVCLGHQAICEALGGKIIYAKSLMHGKVSEVYPVGNNGIFARIEAPFKVARYHSLAVDKNLPEGLEVIAETKDGEVMAVGHKSYKLVGLQFHPESVLTPDGRKMIENFFA